MARTPTDPTKPEVWVTKGLDELDFEFYIPQGPKGDPGGFVDGTELGTTNLNQIITPGVYKQTASGANVTTLNNYPFTGIMAVLTVYRARTSDILQIIEPGNGIRTGVVSYKRASADGGATWGTWRAQATQRVDQTAGRAIYAWDDLNNRDQLIYGDTGGRIISDLVDASKWTGYTLKLRRIGYMVELRILGLQLAAGVTGTQTVMASSLPTGFQNQHSFGFPAIDNQGIMAGGNMSFGGGPMILQNPVAGRSYSALLTWQTANPWPTTLPGTADGAIQNL